MSTPGEMTSGLMRASAVGPRPENAARYGPSKGEDHPAPAPTVIAPVAEPGAVIVPCGSPPLPAAATTTLPLVVTAASTACEIASRPSEGRSEPRLIEITSTLGRSAHHWMPMTANPSSP
jgi:hypothetical protein